MAWEDTYQGPTATATAPAASAAAPRASGGGLSGFLYKNLIQPTVKTVSSIPGDISHVGQALGTTVSSVAQGHHGAQLQADKQKAFDELKGSSYSSALPATVQQAEKGSVANTLEKVTGKTVSNATNVAAFVPGAGEIEGAAKVANIAKTGAKLGAAGAVGGAMQNGESAGNVIGSGIEGAALGGATAGSVGLAGKGVSAITNKLSGKGAAVAAEGAPPKLSMAGQAATKAAQSAHDQELLENFGHPGTDTKDIQPVLAQMQKHGLQPNIEHMTGFGNAGRAYEGIKGYLLDNHSEPVDLDLDSVIDRAVKSQPGLGQEGNATKSNLRQTLRDALGVKANLTGKYDPRDVYQATKVLRSAKSSNPAVQGVFAAARNDLTEAINKSGGFSEAVSRYKLPSVEEAEATGAKAGDMTPGFPGHSMEVLNFANHNRSLANEIIGKVNDAKNFQDLQKAQLPHIRAGEISGSASDAINSALPKAAPGSVGDPRLSTVYEAGSLAHGNLAAAPVLAAKAARSNPVQKLLARQGTADMSQVGAKTAPDVSNPIMISPSTETTPTTTTPTHSLAGTATNLVSRLSGNAAGSAVSPTTTATPGVPSTAGADTIASLAATANAGASQSAAPDALAQPDALNPSSGQSYSQANLQADIERDPANADKYEAIYKDLNPASDKTDLSSTQSNQVVSLKDAATAVGNYAKGLSEVQGSSGVGTGKVSILLGKLGIGGPQDTQAAALDSQRTELATQIAKAITNGKPSSNQINQWKEALPAITDSQSVAQKKLDLLATNLEGYLNVAQTPLTTQ